MIVFVVLGLLAVLLLLAEMLVLSLAPAARNGFEDFDLREAAAHDLTQREGVK